MESSSPYFYETNYQANMKILIITHSFVREVSELVRYAAKIHFPAHFSLVMPYLENHSSLPVDFVSLRRLYFTRRMRAAYYAPTLMIDILRCRPDILHVFEEFSGFIAVQSVFFNSLSGKNSRVMVYSAENLPNNMHSLFRLLKGYVTARSDRAFVCSYGVKEVLEQEGFDKTIDVLPLGVDTKIFFHFPVDRLKTELQLNGQFVLGYVGRLLEMKGIFILIDLMKWLPAHVHLLIIGSGSEEQNVRKQVVEAHLEKRVHFVGNVSYSQLPQYLNCMDIGIVPSKTTPRWKEQFGRVLVEFMSCQIPVVGSDSGSIPEVLGEAGLIFPEKNIQLLRDYVTMLLSNSIERQRLGQRGRERVLENYSLTIMCERLINIYKQLIAE